MFSHCYQIGESIEIFNCQDRKLFSKWGFVGKHSKVYDPNLHAYEIVLSTGNISKMEIPKSSFNSKNKSLSIFQGFIVFQLYLFTSKGLTIEIAISDTTNAKRRLIFSSNNSDLAINQLHCRIPIFKFPIGRWVNLSIDILSFVSKCYKDLTFRSVDYISLSMSGKVRYIFTMRTPLIELNNNFELDDEGNIINNNNNSNNEFDDMNNSNSKIKDNSENNIYTPGAKDIPDKYKFLPHEEIINMNINCNKVFSQIYIENENKQIMLSQKEIYSKAPILIQDTADAHNMDKSLKFRHQIYMNNHKRMNKNKFDYFNGNQFSEDEFKKSNNMDYNAKNNKMNFLKINSKTGTYDKPGNRFNKVGNLIMSHNINNNFNKNLVNKKSTYNFERNNINLNMNMNINAYRDINNDINKNELINEKEFINLSKENNNDNDNDNDRYENNNQKYDLFNKEEYNKLYNKGQGLTSQIKKNLNINNNNYNKYNINDFDEKLSQISTIKNDNLDMIENFEYNNNFDLGKGNIEDEKNNEDMINDDGRPFSPPITKLEEGEF